MRALELTAHSVKGKGKLADLGSAIHSQFIIEIALAQCAGAGDQGFQWTRHGAGNGNGQH